MTKQIGLLLGAGLFLMTHVLPAPAGMSDAAWLTAGVGMLMAAWWASEAMPVPVTSLLPIILFPMLGLNSIREATAPYAHPIIYLLLGGFIIATAMQRWQLHRRFALTILARVNGKPQTIIAAFMVATAFLSMWISNTATTIMMIPVALSLADVVLKETGCDRDDDQAKHFILCLILGIAYSASIGGLGTLVGTPPNAMVAAFMSESFQMDIGFVQWMMFGLPIVMVMIPLGWYVLTHWVFRFELAHSRCAGTAVDAQLAAMGNMSTPEKRTAIMLVLIALSWITRPLLQQFAPLEHLSDTIIAIGGATILCLIPAGDSKDSNARLLDWDTAKVIPWGVLLLFGGGLSLANAISQSGLAQWLGDVLAVLTDLHPGILILCLVTLVIFLTELTSNTATTATLLPVMGAIAVSADFAPILLTAPMALAASCAFMLPVATAPNAIVYASGNVTIAQMARAGLCINIIGIFVITVLSYFLIPVLFL